METAVRRQVKWLPCAGFAFSSQNVVEHVKNENMSRLQAKRGCISICSQQNFVENIIDKKSHELLVQFAIYRIF